MVREIRLTWIVSAFRVRKSIIMMQFVERSISIPYEVPFQAVDSQPFPVPKSL